MRGRQNVIATTYFAVRIRWLKAWTTFRSSEGAIISNGVRLRRTAMTSVQTMRAAVKLKFCQDMSSHPRGLRISA